MSCKDHFALRRRCRDPRLGLVAAAATAIATAVTIMRRRYGTKYTAKVTSTSATGRSLSAEVAPLPPLPSDARGYALPRRDLVCEATRILLHQSGPATSSSSLLDPFSDLADFLGSLSISLTTAEASEILKSLNRPRLALEFFRFCPSLSQNFQHDPYTYTRLLLILSKSASPDRFDLVRSVLSDMDRSGVHGTISTVNILIGFFGRSSDLDMCLGLVKKWDLNMNCYTYKCLLQAYLRSCDSTKAFETYQEMRRRGYKLDIFAYNMLLDALAKDEKVDEARMIFKDMRKKHCEPDEFTYTIMIRTMGKSGKADESLALFQEMIEKGCAPNLIAYNTMIEALARNKMVEKAIFVFSKMVEKNCRPNEFTYSVIVNALVAEGKLGRLDKILEMSKKFMTRWIYAYLVKTLSKLGQAGEAHRLFCDMWSYHDRVDREACLSMLESLCEAGKTAEATELLSKVHEKGLTPETIMYNAVFSALGKLKQTSHLHELYNKMRRDGPSPDIFTYNILIAGFGRAGRVAEAVELFEELERSDVCPDVVSYNSLINCLGKNGDVDEAHMRFEEMRERGLCPDVVTYSTLIECFGKTERVEMAHRLFDKMIDDGCAPNVVTYNILLDCLEQSGRTSEAVDLYAKLKQQGLTPDSITYSILERLQSGSRGKPRVRRQSPITGWVVSPLR